MLGLMFNFETKKVKPVVGRPEKGIITIHSKKYKSNWQGAKEILKDYKNKIKNINND